jgi:hypothetical protein
MTTDEKLAILNDNLSNLLNLEKHPVFVFGSELNVNAANPPILYVLLYIKSNVFISVTAPDNWADDLEKTTQLIYAECFARRLAAGRRP